MLRCLCRQMLSLHPSAKPLVQPLRQLLVSPRYMSPANMHRAFSHFAHWHSNGAASTEESGLANIRCMLSS